MTPGGDRGTMVRGGGKSIEAQASDDDHDLRKLKVVELQARLRELKLPSSGTKEALFQVYCTPLPPFAPLCRGSANRILC
jgi:hypothetical protein